MWSPPPHPSPSRALQPARGPGAASLIQIYDLGLPGPGDQGAGFSGEGAESPSPLGTMPTLPVCPAGRNASVSGWRMGFPAVAGGGAGGSLAGCTMLQPLGDLDAIIADMRTSILSKAGLLL